MNEGRNEGMKEGMNEWRKEWRNEERKEWRKKGMNEWRKEGIKEERNEWMKEWIKERSKEGMNEGKKEGRNEGRNEGRKKGRMDRRKHAKKEGVRSTKMTLEYKKTNLGIHTDRYFSRIYTYEYVTAGVRHVTSYQHNYRPFQRQGYRVELLNFTVYWCVLKTPATNLSPKTNSIVRRPTQLPPI